jgi:hypothetical protein
MKGHGQYYKRYTDSTNLALALSQKYGFDKKIKFTYYQGESDALRVDSANNWLGNVTQILSDLAIDFDAPIVELVVVRVHNNATYSSIVRASQETFDNVINTDDLDPTLTHILPANINTLGVRYWQRTYIE